MKSETQINELVYSLHITPRYLGCRYLCYALKLCMENEDYLLRVWKWLYPEVATKFNTSRSNVEHNIRTAIISGWKKGGSNRFQELCTYKLNSIPSNNELLCILVNYLHSTES